ncbi:MAG: DUF5666 domain-containing protein [Terriglobia bacterium]
MKTRCARPLAAMIFLASLTILPPLPPRTARASALLTPAQDQNSQFNLEGKITDLSPGKLTVSTEDNIIFHVTYGDKTEIHRKDGTAGSAKDLSEGEKIKVDGMLTPAGVIEAQRIDLE